MYPRLGRSLALPSVLFDCCSECDGVFRHGSRPSILLIMSTPHQPLGVSPRFPPQLRCTPRLGRSLALPNVLFDCCSECDGVFRHGSRPSILLIMSTPHQPLGVSPRFPPQLRCTPRFGRSLALPSVLFECCSECDGVFRHGSRPSILLITSTPHQPLGVSPRFPPQLRCTPARQEPRPPERLI